MSEYVELVRSVTFDHQTVTTYSDELIPIGRGRSAVAFKMKSESKVIKIFYPEYTDIAVTEAAVYNKLRGIPYYPTCYEAGDGYLVIDFIEGETIYNCLIKGIVVPEFVATEVDKAIALARQRSLHPSDVHIRNILLTPHGEVRLIDVARFANETEDRQWEDLKRAYYTLYQKPFFPKMLPAALVDAIGHWYVQGQLPFYRRSGHSLRNRG